MDSNRKLQKDTRIKKEVSKLRKIFKELEGHKKSISDNLIQELAFITVTLEELKEEINSSGSIDEMSQGNYSILREHPALKTYNTLVQRYTGLYKQLMDLFPKQPKDSNKKKNNEPDQLQEFLSKKKGDTQ